MADARATIPASAPGCRVCGVPLSNAPFAVPEMSMGTGERFHCVECPGCGSIQLLDAPKDMARYYPDRYYSFALRRQGAILQWLKRQRAESVFGGSTLVSRLVRTVAGDPPFAAWARPPYVTRVSSVLDVGAGGGNLLREMALAGFTDLQGVDPFVSSDTEPSPGVKLRKGSLNETPGRFDTVMLHHVLEHFEDPAAAMREVARVTKVGGYAIVRVPISGTYAWRTYGASWVQLDPPRHVCVPSERGMKLLALAGGFEIVETKFDSTAFQFWGSEQVRRGIPLHDPRSVHVRGGNGGFTGKEMRSYTAKAEELNRAGDGDQACFYLRRSTYSPNSTGAST